MRFALSTNWNCRRLADGAAIADEAMALGFDALELGFNTQPEHLPGLKSRLDAIPVDSVHAYAPVPIGAPGGSPELHYLASHDPDERALAKVLLKKSIAVAEDFGARAVVLHAGRVRADSLFGNLFSKPLGRRRLRGPAMVGVFRKEIDELIPLLEKANVKLAFENLPYIEAFPDEDELDAMMKDYSGAPIGAWFDTGHARVRFCSKWAPAEAEVAKRQLPYLVGMHFNDVKDVHDDHFQPGGGNVDFAALAFAAAPESTIRVVEPNASVAPDALKSGLALLRGIYAS